MSGNRAARKARAVGINHVALEVGDIDDALAFYGGFLDFEIARRSESAAFIYFGDQFINFSRGAGRGPTTTGTSASRSTTRTSCAAPWRRWGWRSSTGGFSIFSTPGETGSRSRPTRTSSSARPTTVLRGMGLEHLRKTDEAVEGARNKGMAPA